MARKSTSHLEIKYDIYIMNKLFTIIFMSSYLMATFSIVAVDTTTGEVGSAGGSCISGSIIISDIHPGVGAIHTQAYYSRELSHEAPGQRLFD